MNGMIYQGDDNFSKLLEELKCPKSLSEIKMHLLGAIAATEMVMPSKVLPGLWGNKDPDFEDENQAKDFFGSLMGLWNIMAQYQDDIPYELTKFPPAKNKEDIVKRINTRKSETTAFVKGLALGNTNPEEMTSDGQDAFKHFATVSAQYEHFLILLKKEDPRDFNETSNLFNEMDHVLEDCIRRIVHAQKEQRAKKMARIVGDRPPNKIPSTQKHERNAPCSCGSGRKWKKCCGS